MCLLIASPILTVAAGCSSDEPTVAIDTRSEAEIAAENAAYEEEMDEEDPGE